MLQSCRWLLSPLHSRVVRREEVQVRTVDHLLLQHEVSQEAGECAGQGVRSCLDVGAMDDRKIHGMGQWRVRDDFASGCTILTVTSPCSSSLARTVVRAVLDRLIRQRLV